MLIIWKEGIPKMISFCPDFNRDTEQALPWISTTPFGVEVNIDVLQMQAGHRLRLSFEN